MCAKFHQVISGSIPPGRFKNSLKEFYYKFYYNRKHYADNGFDIYFNSRNGCFDYRFGNGIRFSSYENMADELKRSLRGYTAEYAFKEGDIVLDCGAYIGEFTLYAAKAVGLSGVVVAFEPDHENLKKLHNNIKLNGLNNIIVIGKGIWSCDSTLKFVGDSIKGYSFISADKDDAAINIGVVSIDNELTRLGIKRVDFIKADVEGAELELVKGAINTLDRYNVHLAIASYHKLDGDKTFLRLEKLLESYNYSARTAHPAHLTTYACKKK